MISRKIPVFLLLIIFGQTPSNVFGLDPVELPDIFINKCFDPDIHSISLKNSAWEFSAPVIDLGSDQHLELRFDDLSGEARTFGYTLVHCDLNWHKSDLQESEYLQGFTNGVIKDSRQSLNTTWFYINYSLLFPEENIMPLISGNYALVVYDESDPERIILVRRFFITENSMKVEATVRQPSSGMISSFGQQLQFSVDFNSKEIRDPSTEITTIAMQNIRFDKQLTFKKPYITRSGRLEFSDPDSGIFNAGNEFRTLDIKSMRYQTENIAGIDFRNPYYHVIMKPDNIRSNKPWFSKTDLNGSYYVDKERTDDRHTEADYIYVHFRLELPLVYSADPVYVAGEFTNWEISDEYRLKQNPDNGFFETVLLVKQGLYDYCYLMPDPETGKINEYQIEGSFYETENDYSIFVYFQDSFKRYTRLGGYLSLK